MLLRGEKKIFFLAQITFLLHLESLEPYLKKNSFKSVGVTIKIKINENEFIIIAGKLRWLRNKYKRSIFLIFTPVPCVLTELVHKKIKVQRLLLLFFINLS